MKQDYSALPRDDMKKIRVAFDVDGTLRCNGGKRQHAAGVQSKCDEFCQEPNERIVAGFMFLAHMKNTEMYVWSGGGADYARHFAELYQLPVKPARCISKFGAPQMDVCVDDIQDTALASFNLIVREK